MPITKKSEKENKPSDSSKSSKPLDSKGIKAYISNSYVIKYVKKETEYGPESTTISYDSNWIN